MDVSPSSSKVSADTPLTLWVATVSAPLLLMLPVIVLEATNSSPSEPFRWGPTLGVPVLAAAIAGMLQVASGRAGRSRRLEVGIRWILAFALSAVAFTNPSRSDVDPGIPGSAFMGAIGGALTAVIFSAMLRLSRRTAG